MLIPVQVSSSLLSTEPIKQEHEIKLTELKDLEGIAAYILKLMYLVIILAKKGG